jgi:hypothetical protein
VELVKIESEGGFSYYTVEFGDGREAFLTLKDDEKPPRVIKGHAIGVLTAEETLATVDEASDWLLSHLW